MHDPTMEDVLLRVGTVPYLNAAPLTEGLSQRRDLKIVSAPPSRLAELLRQGALDAALVSSIELFRQPGLAIVPGGCIASRGEVLSVILATSLPPSHWRRVALDGASRTAAVQVQILLETRLHPGGGVDLLHPGVDVDPLRLGADATLLIGDRALRWTLRGPDAPGFAVGHLDAGQLWEEFFGVPFVYAAWLTRCRGTQAERLHEILEEARARGLQRLEEIARREGPPRGFSGREALDYLSRRIHYVLGTQEMTGLDLYGKAAAALGHGCGARPRTLAAEI